MSDFIITPTNVDFLESIFRNPITGRWTIPILTFNTNYVNPYFGEIDTLNDDPRYQKNVVDNFYTRLTEKWLYKKPVFKSLLKYFRVDKNGSEGRVQLIADPDKISELNTDEQYQKHVFKYIEKYFITRHFVDKVLRQYVRTTHIKWYDLFHNTDTVKDLFAHKLKKLIISTIYELQYRKNENKNIEPIKRKSKKQETSETSNSATSPI